MTDEKRDSPHDHLQIHALVDGGYVIREGQFDHGERFENGGEARWFWRQERAAFATLEDALKWVNKNMVHRSPDLKR